MSAAGGTDTANYVTRLNEANLRGTLTGYTTNLLNCLQINYPNASVEDITGGRQIVPATNTAVKPRLVIPTYTDNNTLSVANLDDEPTNFMSTFHQLCREPIMTWLMPQLQGQGSRSPLARNGTGANSGWEFDGFADRPTPSTVLS